MVSRNGIGKILRKDIEKRREKKDFLKTVDFSRCFLCIFFMALNLNNSLAFLSIVSEIELDGNGMHNFLLNA